MMCSCCCLHCCTKRVTKWRCCCCSFFPLPLSATLSSVRLAVQHNECVGSLIIRQNGDPATALCQPGVVAAILPLHLASRTFVLLLCASVISIAFAAKCT